MTVSTLLGRMTAMPNALLLPLLPLAVLCSLGFLLSAPHYRTPEQLPYWIFFFGLPHIVSSFQTMCDTEYLTAYRKQLPLIFGLFLLPFALHQAGMPAAIIFTIVLILTVHHVVAQQYGIALSVARLRPSILSAICKWSTVALGIVAYFQCYFAADLVGNAHYGMLVTVADFLMMPLLWVIAVGGSLLAWQARQQRTGAVLLALNILLLMLALILIFKTPYMLVGLMLARILHDISGFVVYIGHDSARNRVERKNLLYRVFPFLPIWLLNLAFALAIAAGLTYLSTRMAFIGWLVIGITIAHYYIEGRIWRGGTPHRQHFRLSGA
jgi:hypothetical protein